MIKRLLIFTFIFFGLKLSNAQNSYPQKSTIATLYLQTDNQKYLSEETVWFKCYLQQSGLPATGNNKLIKTKF